MQWLRTVRSVLEKEPETWLAYLYGQQFQELNHLKELHFRYQGVAFRVAVFFYLLLRDMRLSPRPRTPGKHRLLFYAGTANQRDALAPTINALKERGEGVLAVADPRALQGASPQSPFVVLRPGAADLPKIALIFLLRIHRVLRSLKPLSDELRKKRFNLFCEPHSYLVIFERLIKETSPELIVVSNDHNASCRSLISLGRELDVKTAYLQHASVSPLFPALNVDYAFLDGAAALDTYRMCEKNHVPNHSPDRQRHVYLSGQKKPMRHERRDGVEDIGIALNALDAPEHVLPVLDALESEGFVPRVRWHPNMKARRLEPLWDILSKRSHVAVSNPANESVAAFLSKLVALVAGNSSIHLEAALAGVTPIYYEFGDATLRDYYGYASSGLCRSAETLSELIDLSYATQNRTITVSQKAVQYYSATFQTRWEGREGELVAGNLISLLNGADPRMLWGYAAI